MTLIEAEKYFKRFDGFFFHMGREEPQNYNTYKALKISEETEEQWRQEIINNYFEHLFNAPDRVWYKFSTIVSIIYSTKTLKEKNCIRLISALKKMSYLDKMSKVLIIEQMAGNRGMSENGACALICMSTSSEQRKRMNEIVLKLADFTCTEEDDQPGFAFNNIKKRHIKAVENYKARYEIYKDANPSRIKLESIDQLIEMFPD